MPGGAGAARQRPETKVSIIPRGIGGAGYPLRRPTEDRYLMTRTELQRKLARAAGRAAPPRCWCWEGSPPAPPTISPRPPTSRARWSRATAWTGLGHVAYEPPRSATPELAMLGGQGRARSQATAAHRRCGVLAWWPRGFAGADAVADAASCAAGARRRAAARTRDAGRDDLRELAAPLRASGTLTTRLTV